ncbi:peptidoglycan-binding domain-containing protein [Kribbella sp. CA-247076]|uniref:peptidoglycan-binding domain-containing protein n=1 Tax=Kribbella sp. CA-247076 TaxID=3239941 RepID=UPI003D8FEE46
MRNPLRRPRTREIVVATLLAGGLVCGLAAATHASVDSPAAAPAVASPDAATEATAATEAAAEATCSGTYLSLGSTGTCVRLLQKNLGGLAVDGVYGSGTQSRVRSFQDDAGIGVDGKVGPQTWAKLRTYGKAVGWKAGVTVYLCKVSSSEYRYSSWNNSGKKAWWTMDVVRQADDMRYGFSGNGLADDRIVAQGRIGAGAYDSRMLTVILGQFDPGSGQTTTAVRDFSRNTLPACA